MGTRFRALRRRQERRPAQIRQSIRRLRVSHDADKGDDDHEADDEAFDEGDCDDDDVHDDDDGDDAECW